MQISTTLSRTKIPYRKTNELYASVKVTAPRRLQAAARTALDLIVVLDVSGSMGDAVPSVSFESLGLETGRGVFRQFVRKIDIAKFALNKLVDQLDPADRISLVTFDTGVELVFDLSEHEKGFAHREVNRMEPKSMTNLSGGLYRAFDVVRAAKPALDTKTTRLTRIFLFTDGEANHGDTTLPPILSRLGKDYRTYGDLAISTFGIGTTHNVELLNGLSRCGGAYHFLDNAEKIPVAVGTEYGAAATVFTDDLKLVLEPTTPRVESIEILNDLPTRVEGGQTIVDCGTLIQEQTFTVVAKLTTKSSRKKADAITAAVLQTSAEWTTLGTSQKNKSSSLSSVSFTTQDEADTKDNEEVMRDVAIQNIAKQQREATAKAERGDYKGAQVALYAASTEAMSFGLTNVSESFERLADNVGDQQTYQERGRGMANSYGGTFTRQRASTTNSLLDDTFATPEQKKQQAAFRIKIKRDGSKLA